MTNKLTNLQVVWLLVVLTNSFSSAVSSCNTTIKVGTSGRITIPSRSSYCEWKMVNDDDMPISLSFSDFHLTGCPRCNCEAIEIWTVRPKRLLGKICGNVRDEEVHIHERRFLVKYSSRSGFGAGGRYIYYKRYSDTDHDHKPHHRRRKHRKHNRGGRTSDITTTAIGILLALVILVVAMACGICLVHCIKPNIRRQPSVRQAPDTSEPGPKLPHLPNYYDNEGAVPPPYLETIGTDGNSVNPPNYDECPPPYSILDTSGALETTGETRASDRVSQTL